MQRYLEGELGEEQFRPLRLQNGLYIQRKAPMLRIAVPYGLLSSQQLRKLASLTRDYDKGYAHVSTRQNFQLNWPELERVPDLLGELAEVDMHCIQTSGNCIRNTTTDQFAGVSPDEVVDPRPYCELIRQWSTLHPEFAFLPRKFKIAVCGSQSDRAAIYSHDIGLALQHDRQGNLGVQVLVGGGLGRTPVIGSEIESWLDIKHLLSYLEAVLRVYNQLGRRDNKYKARIKILVRAMGVDKFREAVHREWSKLKDGDNTLTEKRIEDVRAHFRAMPYEQLDATAEAALLAQHDDPIFKNWLKRNTRGHKVAGYRAVTVALKHRDLAPGDITADQLDHLAELADRFSFSEARTTHHQNMVLADVRERDLHDLWTALQKANLATANAGYLTDMICCPGGDFCSLANAKSIPVSDAIRDRFDDLDYLYDLGPIELNISGCMNACGHHHIGHIGILGVDKKGKEFFQVSLGGRQAESPKIGKILGPSFGASEIPEVIAKILERYVELRQEDELFIDTIHRVGIEPFKERVYG
ncbi:sulfite reductase (ferredoxin) [Luminiphilus syltensis NOR5-1B]|uniref:Sulfite reductase (Ferredoxin) n=2 Tax=Luminiphilus TaxID=1341118 RepID=B8KQY1_9GAMM|nr:sulfite reductase (ferredoxin) [Luminiphilus syltensis NOR5-1B]